MPSVDKCRRSDLNFLPIIQTHKEIWRDRFTNGDRRFLFLLPAGRKLPTRLQLSPVPHARIESARAVPLLARHCWRQMPQQCRRLIRSDSKILHRMSAQESSSGVSSDTNTLILSVSRWSCLAANHGWIVEPSRRERHDEIRGCAIMERWLASLTLTLPERGVCSTTPGPG